MLVGAGYHDHGLVFPLPDGCPQPPDNFTKAFERKLKTKAFEDLPAVRLHDLRHMWATLALEAGVDVDVVSKRLGHSPPAVTWGTYQHVRQGMQSDAAERVAASIFGRGGTKRWLRTLSRTHSGYASGRSLAPSGLKCSTTRRRSAIGRAHADLVGS